MAAGAILHIVESPYINEKSFDFDKIWYTTAYLELDDNHVTKYEFFKFKMVDTRRIENRFLAITPQPIARFQWNFA